MQLVCVYGAASHPSTCCFLDGTDFSTEDSAEARSIWAELSAAAVVSTRHVELQSAAAVSHVAPISTVGEVEAGGPQNVSEAYH